MGPFRNEPLTDFSKPENLQAMKAAIEKVRGELGREYPLIIGGKKVMTKDKLKSIKEGDRTLLDNSMILFGSSFSDGNRHDPANLPILLAGSGNGSVKPGRHVKYPNETPLTNLWLSMIDRAGATGVSSLGDSTGRLENL